MLTGIGEIAAIHSRRRAQALGDYRDRAGAYVAETDPSVRERRRSALLRLDHPTVWREMQRQHREHEELRRLFAKAPALLRAT